MKKVFATVFAIVFAFFSVFAQAGTTILTPQSGKVGKSLLAGYGTSGNLTPSAILEGRSTTKGFLTPRMTTVQRNAISAPATGLIVYDTNLNSLYYYYSSAWHKVSESLSIGVDTLNVTVNPYNGFIMANMNPAEDLFVLGDSTNGQFLAYGNLGGDGTALVNYGNLYLIELTTQNGYQKYTNIIGTDTGMLSFNTTPSLVTTLHGQLKFGFANYKTGTVNVANIYCAKTITPGEYEDVNYMACEYDTATGQSRVIMDVRPDSVTSGKDRQLILDKNKVYLAVAGITKASIDTSGIVTFGSLDSVTAYALTPPNGSKVYCNNCTGNGVTGRFISYIGSAWRRETFQ